MSQFALNSNEIEQARALLSRLEPGYLPFPIFLEMCRLKASAVIELVPFRRTDENKVEILMLQRPQDDPLWPNLWHNPGTVVRAGDTYESCMERLLRDELGGLLLSRGPIFADTLISASERGTDAMQVYWAELNSSRIGRFWPLEQLPEDMIQAEIPAIHAAAAQYGRSWDLNKISQPSSSGAQ